MPRPVGVGYDISLEQAKECDKDEGHPLSLVEIKAAEVKAAEEQAQADLEAGRVAAALASRGKIPVANEGQITDEKAAVSGKES